MKFGKRGRVGLAIGAVAAALTASVAQAGAANATSYLAIGSSGPGVWCVQVGLDATDNGDLFVVQDAKFGP
ncbi:hypothetical protein ACFQ9X_35935 [Catenulispora yoronensis]